MQMAARHVQDVQLILEHVIQSHVQETANGLHGIHGPNALQLVMAELRTEQEKFYRKQLTEEKTVTAHQLSLEIATLKNVQLTVNGPHGVHGTFVLEHVVVECKQEVAPSYNKKDMEAGPVKVIHRKCKDVTWKHAQSARTAQDMHDSVQHGQIIALAASLFKDVAKSPVDCAKIMTPMHRITTLQMKMRCQF